MAKGLSEKVKNIRRNEQLAKERKKMKEDFDTMNDVERQKLEIRKMESRINNLKYDLKSIDSPIIRHKLQLMEKQLEKDINKLEEMKNDNNK